MGFRLDYLGFCLKLGQGMSLTWSLWFWFRIEENSSYMGTYLRGEVGLVGFIGWLGCYCAVFAAVFSWCTQVLFLSAFFGCWAACSFGIGCIWVAGLCLLLLRLLLCVYRYIRYWSYLGGWFVSSFGSVWLGNNGDTVYMYMHTHIP